MESQVTVLVHNVTQDLLGLTRLHTRDSVEVQVWQVPSGLFCSLLTLALSLSLSCVFCGGRQRNPPGKHPDHGDRRVKARPSYGQGISLNTSSILRVTQGQGLPNFMTVRM